MAKSKDKKLDPRLLPLIDEYIEALFSGEKKPEKLVSKAHDINFSVQLRKPEVHAEVTKRIENYLSLTDLDKVKVLLELKKMAFTSIADVIDFDGSSVKPKSFSRIQTENPEALDAIQSIKQNSFGEVEVKMYSKTDALDKLSKIFNMQQTTVQVNHSLVKPGLFDDFDPDEIEEEV